MRAAIAITVEPCPGVVAPATPATVYAARWVASGELITFAQREYVLISKLGALGIHPDSVANTTRTLPAAQLDTGATVIAYDGSEHVVTTVEDGPGVVFVDYADGSYSTFKPGHPVTVTA